MTITFPLATCCRYQSTNNRQANSFVCETITLFLIFANGQEQLLNSPGCKCKCGVITSIFARLPAVFESSRIFGTSSTKLFDTGIRFLRGPRACSSSTINRHASRFTRRQDPSYATPFRFVSIVFVRRLMARGGRARFSRLSCKLAPLHRQRWQHSDRIFFLLDLFESTN